MPSTATVTGKIGPGLTATAVVLPDVSEVRFNIGAQVLVVTSGGVQKTFDLYTIATVTYSISSHNVTLTVST